MLNLDKNRSNPIVFLFLVIASCCFCVYSIATSIPLPNTNVSAIRQSEVVVVGELTGSQRQEIWTVNTFNNEGNSVTRQQSMTITEFVVTEVLAGSGVQVGEKISLNSITPSRGDVSSRFNGSWPKTGERVVLGLQDDWEGSKQGIPGFIIRNREIVNVNSDADLLETKRWVDQVRRADQNTINKMVREEWASIGFDPNQALQNNDDGNDIDFEESEDLVDSVSVDSDDSGDLIKPANERLTVDNKQSLANREIAPRPLPVVSTNTKNVIDVDNQKNKKPFLMIGIIVLLTVAGFVFFGKNISKRPN